MSAIDPAIVQAVLALKEAAAAGDPAPADPPGGPEVTAVHRRGRFLTLGQVAEELAVSPSTVGALIKRGRLQALKVDGRQWRIERAKLEEFILAAYAASTVPTAPAARAAPSEADSA